MKTWKLSPINSKGYVRIRAQTEDRAREIAYERFANTNVANVIHTVNWSQVHWQDKNQVLCKPEEDDLSSIEGILDIV